MKIKETKILQSQRLKEICNEKGVNFNSIETLLDSIKTKKLHSRKNYHQQKIDDTINNSLK